MFKVMAITFFGVIMGYPSNESKKTITVYIPGWHFARLQVGIRKNINTITRGFGLGWFEKFHLEVSEKLGIPQNNSFNKVQFWMIWGEPYFGSPR